MLTYRDLRKEKKGIALCLLEIGITIGIILYDYFFELHILFPTGFLTNIKASNGLVYLLSFVLIYSLLSYFTFYTRTLGLIYQFIAAIPTGLIVADIASINLILSIFISLCLYNLIYYFSIMRPVSLSENQYYADQEANGVTQFKYLGSMPNGQRRLNRLLDRYDSLNNKAMHIFSHMRASGEKYPKQFTFISKEIISIKNSILADLTELCEAEDDLFDEIYEDVIISLDELDSDVSSLHTLFNLHLSESNRQEQYEQRHYEDDSRQKLFEEQERRRQLEERNRRLEEERNKRLEEERQTRQRYYEEDSPIPKTKREAFDFFLGCEDMATLKKRYRDLMKTYHSDGIAGNEEIATQINMAYEEAKQRLS